MGIENIEHVVVVMFENRSFDNLLGWLYDAANPPNSNIPPNQNGLLTFDGLVPGQYSNEYSPQPGVVQTVAVTKGTQEWPPSCPNSNQVPTPDPNEEFDFVTNQLFGTKNPPAGASADMSGFLKDYATADGVKAPEQIMGSYSPDQAAVINQIAKSFAVCDRWFAPVPSQTWPNRGFMHSGCSDGHLNNDNSEPYDIPTIFNVLADQGKSWGVFHDTTIIPSLTWLQFSPRLTLLQSHFHKYPVFQQLCQAQADAPPAQKLPSYSFVEPRFTPELKPFSVEVDFPSDYHPPHNICRGEQFLADVYQCVRTSPYRDKILLIITFDEHGGCYDHVVPPNGASSPNPGAVSRELLPDKTPKFKFDRFGVRVPTIVVSSYVEGGTVFRSNPGESPYDHTSILATLRDWPALGLDKTKFLPSGRIAAAPTLDRVLTRDQGEEIPDWPDIKATCVIDGTADAPMTTPISDLQANLLASAKADLTDTSLQDAVTQVNALNTYADALDFLQPQPPVAAA